LALTPGTRLGVYEVLAAIGEGGMGQVYRARDAKLNRDVALKVLPDAFASDPDRLARFTREAQTLASLNHPNIAHIHGLEESGGVRALVMELVDGDDLSQRIARGAIPIDEALRIAKQIADALEDAHERGIIHRDLKPANIKIRADGTVKVLDFGLAKAMDPTGAMSPEMSQSPTITTPAMTRAGTILGTAAYMSPEQARGKTVDKRADIWAFGCVVYEMLTGQRAFKGEETSDVLAAVLRQDLDWSVLPAAPTRLRRLLMRCLDRDPRTRLRDIGEARVEIDRTLAGVGDDAVAPQTTGTSAQSTPASTRTLPWAVAAALVIVAAVMAFGWWRSTRPVERALRPLVRLDVDLGPDVSLGSVPGADEIISPDGTRIVYVSQNRLFTRRLDQPNATELAGTQGALAPFFSPNGQWVAFFAGSKLQKISVDGGSAIILCDAPLGRGGSWGEDGNIVAALSGNASGLSGISSAGGPPTPVTELQNGELTHRWPQILPRGQAVLFTAHTATNGFDRANIEVMSLADHSRKTLVRGGTYGRYLPSGHLVFVNRGTLFAVPFDADRLEAHGTPAPVLDQIGYNAQVGSAQLDFSQTGTLIYRSGAAGGGGLTVAWLDGAGKVQPLLAKPGTYLNPSLSPDGQRLAVNVVEGSGTDIWVYDWQRDTMTRLTFTGTADGGVWSPDGRHIAFQSVGEGLSVIRSDGSGKPQPLTQSKHRQAPQSFAPDGKRLAFFETASRTVNELWTVPLESDNAGLRAGKPERLLQTQANGLSFSSDGRWMAYSSNESGTDQVYVRAFPDGGGQWQISNSGGTWPMWSRNGRELFFETLDNRIMVAAYAVNGDSFAADKPRMWSDKQLATSGGRKNLDLAPDGKRIATLMPVETEAQSHVIFLENFVDDVRRKVPVGK
jgi:Tol biopolymer transport system component